MPSTTSSVVSMLLASSTVMVPSLPTLSIASAMISPMLVSQLAETVATCAISVRSLTFLEMRASSSTRAVDGFVDAALQRGRVRTRRHVAQAFLVDGFREHGRRGGAVAGDVAGLAGDLTHELRAHVLVGVFQFDLLGHGHTVLGDGGRAEFLVEDDVAARRPKRRLDRTGQFLHAAQEGLAGVFVELQLFGCHNS